MGRPRVIIHNLISLDGRLDGFPADAGLYYELASRLPHQAVLTGSGTMLAAAAGHDIDMSGEDTEPSPGAAAAVPAAAGDTRPLLVIVDGRGRLSRYAWLREQPFWCDVLVLCSSATPASHLDRLRRHHVSHVVAGDGRVDLSITLRLLAERYHVGAVRVDAGGGLNGALLQARLVSEVSVVIAPYLAASAAADPSRLIACPGSAGPVALELTAVERLRQGHVWLRYDVRDGPGGEMRAVQESGAVGRVPPGPRALGRPPSAAGAWLCKACSHDRGWPDERASHASGGRAGRVGGDADRPG
jgi:2,5-diamino-6-(ribosylamino)-4(3H)-pyrimidinone 5'-phosphate reductase